MSEAIPVNALIANLPELNLHQRIDTSPDAPWRQLVADEEAQVTSFILSLAQHEINAWRSEIIRYLQENIAQPTSAQTTSSTRDDAIQFIKEKLDSPDKPVTIYDARLSKGNYRGDVVFVNNDYAVQKISAESVIVHPLNEIDGQVIVGQSLQITYQNGQGSAKEWSRSAKNTGPAANPEPADKAQRYELRNVQFDAKGNSKSGPEIQLSNAHSIGLYENMPDGTQQLITDYRPSAAKDIEVVVDRLNKGEIQISDTISILSNHELPDTEIDEIVASINKPAAAAAVQPITTSHESSRAGYEAAKAYIHTLDAEAKISEPRLSKGNYKGSVLNIADGHVVQQIGDRSFVIHDLANIGAGADAIDIGTQHKMRFIYQEGQPGRVEKVDLTATATASKGGAGDDRRPSPAPVQQAPAQAAPSQPVSEARSQLYDEAIKHSTQALGDTGKLYTARTTDNSLSKGELLFVNNGYAVQKIGKTTAVVHDRANIDPGINLKSVQGPVAITYQGGKASLEQLPPDYWKAQQRNVVNNTFAGKGGSVPHPAAIRAPASEPVADIDRA